ncbi:hypothetical protein HanIR_Chr04g0206881 [Helianthus annuus]|nr:hypothetical protein HanIR_Chr04g0206881 [Helianthus annuus]
MRRMFARTRGAISDSDTPVAIENVIIKARYKSGLFVDPSQEYAESPDEDQASSKDRTHV